MASEFPNNPSHSPAPQAPAAGRRETASIGPKTRIKGELQADEDFLIEGSFDGRLLLQKHQLAIGAKGQVEGTAFAHSISVEGQVEGDLYAIERISIRKGAKVKGNVLAPRVSLEDGALLRGTVEMDGEAIRAAIQETFGDLDLGPGSTRSNDEPAKTASGPTSAITAARSQDKADSGAPSSPAASSAATSQPAPSAASPKPDNKPAGNSQPLSKQA